MSNEQNASQTTPSANVAENYDNKYQQPEWIFCEGFLLFETFIMAWTSLSLFTYGKKTGKFRKENRSCETKVNSGAVYTSAVFATCCSLLRVLSNQVVFLLDYTNGSSLLCETAVDVSITCYALTITSTYMFLWFRQRSLYQHPAKQGFRKSRLHWFSWVTLGFIVCGSFLALLAMIIPQSTVISRDGCTRKATNISSFFWSFYVVATLVVVAQGSMLFLLLYPLFSHVKTKNAKRVTKIMKRSAVLAVLCILSDAVAMIIVVFVIPPKAKMFIALTVYDANMVVNIASVLLSFQSWQSIILSPFAVSSCMQPVTYSAEQSSGATSTIRLNIT